METDLKHKRSSTGTSHKCLICNGSTGVTARNAISIFQNTKSSDRTVVKVIDDVLGITYSTDAMHSIVVCCKCYKNLNELVDIENQLVNIKSKLANQYNDTLKCNYEVVDVQNIDTIDTEQEVYTIKPIISHSKIEAKPSKDTLVSYVDTMQNSNCIKENDRLDNSLVENIIVTLKDNKEFYEGSTNDFKNCDTQKLIPPAHVQQEEIQPDLKNIKNIVEGINEDDKKGSTLDDNLDYEADYIIENDGESSLKNAFKEKVPKVLIPQTLVHNNGEIYTCLLCSVDDKFAADARGIIDHLKNIHETVLYICEICGQEFLKRYQLMNHLDDHAKNLVGNFTCDICSGVYTNMYLFKLHKNKHNMSRPKNHVCEFCGRQFASQNLLIEHSHKHAGVQPYNCEICGKDFTTKYTLKSHQKVHTNRERNFICINCGKAFLTEQNLIHHERIHSGLASYVCQECNKTFNTARALELHCAVHTGFKAFICRMCGKSFARKSEIDDHERVHTGEKPFQCEFCGATFSQRSNLQSHKRAAHLDDKRYKCTECGKGFKRRRLLDYHVKAAHTGERPFKCEICQATFIYPEHFKKHHRIHTGEKPFSCEICGKAFNSRDNRNAHRFVHSNKKPYECIVCGIGFMRKPFLYNHMTQTGHLNDTIVINQPQLTNSPVTKEKIQEGIQMSYTNCTVELDSKVDSVDEKTALNIIKNEGKVFAEESKERILLPFKQQLGNDLNSVELVNDEYQIQSTKSEEHGSEHSLNMDHDGDDASVVSMGHMETVSVGDQEQLIVPDTHHTTFNESNVVMFGEHSTINEENGQLVQIHFQGNDEEIQNQWLNIIQPQG